MPVLPMAKVELNGFDEFAVDLAELARMPDSVLDDMLKAEAAVVVKAHKASISNFGLVDTGKLLNSIKFGTVKKSSDGKYIIVSPSGTYPNRKTRVAEVAFINEYGAPGRGIPARQWMKEANEACAEEATKAAYDVYDEYLKSKNL